MRRSRKNGGKRAGPNEAREENLLISSELKERMISLKNDLNTK